MTNQFLALLNISVFSIFGEKANKDKIQANIGKIPMELRERIAFYLENSQVVVDWMDCPTDVLDGSTAIDAGSMWVSDGTYIWSYFSAYYVRKYGVGIPEEFFQHIKNCSYTPRPWSSEKLEAFEEFLIDRDFSSITAID